MEEGKLIPVDKVRGRKKSIQRLADLMEQRANLEDKDHPIGIAHGDDTEAMEMLKQIINERFGMHNIMTGSIGCADRRPFRSGHARPVLPQPQLYGSRLIRQ